MVTFLPFPRISYGCILEIWQPACFSNRIICSFSSFCGFLADIFQRRNYFCFRSIEFIDVASIDWLIDPMIHTDWLIDWSIDRLSEIILSLQKRTFLFQTDDDLPQSFHESFVLRSTNGNFFITNNVFRLVLHHNWGNHGARQFGPGFILRCLRLRLHKQFFKKERLNLTQKILYYFSDIIFLSRYAPLVRRHDGRLSLLLLWLTSYLLIIFPLHTK